MLHFPWDFQLCEQILEISPHGLDSYDFGPLGYVSDDFHLRG